eukprot:283192_1
MSAFMFLILIVHLFNINHSLQFYVSKSHGNNANNGLETTQAFKTLNAAQKAIQSLRKSNHYTDNIIVNIEVGIYEESLYLTALDSNTTWTSYPKNNKLVTISGGQQIDKSSFYSCKSPFSSQNLLCANLSSLGITDIGAMQSGGLIDCQHNKLELYYNGKTQTLARWPNINHNTGLYQYTTTLKQINRTTFTYNNRENTNNIKDWNIESDAWMHGYWSTDFFDSYTRIKNIEYKNNNYDIRGTFDYQQPLSNARFYVVNMLSELDTQTEYYIDKNTLILYWYAPDTKDRLINNIIVSMKQYVIIINDSASDLSFEDISISYSRNTGIYSQGGKDTNWTNINNINITNCVIENHGNNGIDINGRNLKVLNNIVQYTGCKGISVVGGNYFTLQAANNLVRNNTIYDFGKWKRTYMPGLFWAGVGNTYSYNNIQFGPHNSILGGGNEAYGNLGGCNNVFEYNYIANTTFEVTDSGSFYTCGQNGQGWINRGNILRYNTFENIRNLVPVTCPSGDIAPIHAIYFDDQQSGWRAYNNTIINAQGGILIGGGRRDIIKNTYCYNVNYCVHIDNRGQTWQPQPCTPPKGLLWEGLYSVNYQKPPWSTSYPEIVNIASEEPCVPVFADIENNQYCGKNTQFAQCCINLVCHTCNQQDFINWNDTANNNIYKCH